MNAYRTPAELPEEPKEPMQQLSLRQKAAKAIKKLSVKKHSDIIIGACILMIFFGLLECVGQITFCFLKINCSRFSLVGIADAMLNGMIAICAAVVATLCGYGLYHLVGCVIFVLRGAGALFIEVLVKKLEGRK